MMKKITKYSRTDNPDGSELRLLDWLAKSPGLSRYGNRIKIAVNLPAKTAATLHCLLIEKCVGALVSEVLSQVLKPISESLSFDGILTSFDSEKLILGLCQSHRFITMEEAIEAGYSAQPYGNSMDIAVIPRAIPHRSIGVIRSADGWIVGHPDSQEWIVAKSPIPEVILDVLRIKPAMPNKSLDNENPTP